MKKLILLFVIAYTFIGCSFTKKINYVEDEFYPQKSYYYTDWVGVGGTYSLNLAIRFMYLQNTKIIQANLEIDELTIVDKSDNIIIRFKKGNSLFLEYLDRVSDYDGYVSGGRLYSEYNLTAFQIIDDFSDINIIRAETEDFYKNFTVSDKANERLNLLYEQFENAINGREYKKEIKFKY